MVWETRLRVSRGAGSKKGERKGGGAGGVGGAGTGEGKPSQRRWRKTGLGAVGGASEVELRFEGSMLPVQRAKQEAWGERGQGWRRFMEGWVHGVRRPFTSVPDLLTLSSPLPPSGAREAERYDAA